MKAFETGMWYYSTSVRRLEYVNKEFANFLEKSKARYCSCDWGDVSQEDAQENKLALESGDRIVAAYKYYSSEIWIITEADRSATTVMFSNEY